jgi:hypothetical protein
MNGAVQGDIGMAVLNTTFTANAYQLAPTDNGTFQLANNGAVAATYTVPANATVALPVGFTMSITQNQSSADKITITAAGGVTIHSSVSGGFVSGTTGCRVDFSTITLTKTQTNTWILSGDAA